MEHVKIDESARLCFVDGSPVILSKKEYALLNFLLNNPNKMISRKELLERFWTKKVVERNVDATISRIRKKLGIYEKKLMTGSGFGYGWINDVE